MEPNKYVQKSNFRRRCSFYLSGSFEPKTFQPLENKLLYWLCSRLFILKLSSRLFRKSNIYISLQNPPKHIRIRFFYNIIFFRMFQNGKVCMFHKVSSCAFCALLKEIQMPSFLPFLFIHLPLELPSMPCLSISANWILLNLVADYTLKTLLPCTWMYRLTENVGADFFGF